MLTPGRTSSTKLDITSSNYCVLSAWLNRMEFWKSLTIPNSLKMPGVESTEDYRSEVLMNVR